MGFTFKAWKLELGAVSKPSENHYPGTRVEELCSYATEKEIQYARVNPANPRSTTPTPIDPLSQSLSVSGRKSLPAGTSRLSAADSHCKGPEIVEAVAKRMASWEHLLGLSIRQPNPLPVKDDVGDRQRRPSCASMQGMVCCTA